MKKLIYIILSALILSVACHKEDVNKNPLSGKIKRSYYYDSLNILRETTDYIYDSNSKLYTLKSNLKIIQLITSDDSLILISKHSDTITHDTITDYQYAYINNMGYIYKIAYLDNNHIFQYNQEYITDGSGILQSILFEPSVNEYKIFDLAFDGFNYLNLKIFNKIELPFPPYQLLDTQKVNYRYTDIVAIYPFTSVVTNTFENNFTIFGYKYALPNSNLISSYYVNGSSDTTHVEYSINNLNRIEEVILKRNSILTDRTVYDYY